MPRVRPVLPCENSSVVRLRSVGAAVMTAWSQPFSGWLIVKVFGGYKFHFY